MTRNDVTVRPDWGDGGLQRYEVDPSTGNALQGHVVPRRGVQSHTPTGALATHQAVAESSAQAVLDAIPVVERDAIVQKFDALSHEVQHAIITELGVHPGRGRAGEADMQEFASFPGGAQALRSFGNRAPQRVGCFYGRLDRIVGAISEQGFQELFAFLNSLTPEQGEGLLSTLSRQ